MRAGIEPVDIEAGVDNEARISPKDFSKLHAAFGTLQGFVEFMFINDEGKGSLDRFGFGFSAEHGFGAGELVLIELEMFVAYRDGVSHGPSVSADTMCIILAWIIQCAFSRRTE